ncbi:hypothetical protein [Thiothrix subterranea]
MARIQLQNVRKSFGAVDVIKGVDLDIQKGEFMVFVALPAVVSPRCCG